MTNDNKMLLKWGFGILAAVLLLPFVALGYTKFFAPQYEQVRREIYEESKAYNQGKVEHLGRLCRSMRLAKNEGHRSVTAAAIRTEAVTYDQSRLPNDLRDCVQEAQ